MSDDCIFCKIINGKESARIHYQDDEIMVFDDIKPASKFHFLCIPKVHIDNVSYLHSNDVHLVEKLLATGRQVLEDQGGNLNDVRMGFHVPPFNSVSHLHLHIISPSSEMSLLNKVTFRADSYWFKTVDTFMKQLRDESLNNKL